MTRVPMQQAAAGLSFDQAPGVPSALAAEGFIVVLTVLVVPVMLYVGDLAPYERILYPVTNFLLAGYLFARRSPWYAGQCLLLFCFVSLVRRLIDEQAGWDPSNPVLLTPYLCCLLTVISFFGYWSQRYPRYIGAFLAVLLCIAYGTGVAILHGRIYAALVDALKWSVGPLFATYVLSTRDQHAAMRQVVEGCLVWAGALMGAYGLFQYIDPPSWDALWLREVSELGLGNSFGQPAPFAVRVFSTMNSPGSLGTLMCAGIVIGLKRSVPVMSLTVPLMIAGLALCQYRSIWAATLIAVTTVVLSRRGGLRPANAFALLLVGVALCSTTMLLPMARQALVARASSIATLERDESLEARLRQYASLARHEGLVLGEGLGISGAQRRLDREAPVAIDGAFIEICRAMGVVIGTVFLLSLGGLIGPLFLEPLSPGSQILFDRAIVLATFIQLPIGSVHIAEMGFCAWLFLGLALATRAAPSGALR